MACIAMLGYGTVGSGVAELINKNRLKLKESLNEDLIISKILVRNLDKYRSTSKADILTKNVEDVFKSNVDIVIEAMGGIDPAYDYVKKALRLKKHVVTANKDLIAEHGSELLELAKKNDVVLRFEASVGGGIPILKSLSECLVGNKINSIRAIINGTTNFILSKMYHENMDYKNALKLAQGLGFAEANPESDVMGYDAARKLSILSTIAFEERVHWKKININGITDIDAYDFRYAQREGFNIKLLAISERSNNGIYASVAPAMVRKDSTLGRIENEYNAILVEGDAVGDVMFTGKGAGMFPTASAVFSDIVDIIQNKNEKAMAFSLEEASVNTLWGKENRWFLRIKTEDRIAVMVHLAKYFDNCSIVANSQSSLEDQVVAVVKVKNETILNRNIELLQHNVNISHIKKIIMLED